MNRQFLAGIFLIVLLMAGSGLYWASPGDGSSVDELNQQNCTETNTCR